MRSRANSEPHFRLAGLPRITCKQEEKRRGWDSNPRDGSTPPTRFPIALLRPTRTPLRKRRTGVYQKAKLLLREDKSGQGILLALFRFCGVLPLCGAGRVAQGEGTEEYQREGRDGDEGASCPEVVLGGVDPILPYFLVFDYHRRNKEPDTRKEPDDGCDHTNPCRRGHYRLTHPYN